MALQDRWASGDAYEPFIGRWSRSVAGEFVRWLGPRTAGTWLDVGCGTGALTQAILDDAAPAAVHGIDPSPDFVATARRRIQDPRVELSVGDAEAIDKTDSSFDYVVSGLVLNFVPDPSLGVAEMKRVTRPDGRVACYVWDYSGRMQMLRYFWDAVKGLDPQASDLDEGARFEICRPERLRALWEDSGLTEVEVAPIDMPTVFSDFDDYWTPFLGGQGPAPTYMMSLDEDKRGQLRERLRNELPSDDQGRIELVARAWAVVGNAV